MTVSTRLPTALVLSLALLGCGGGGVVRVVDGEEIRGRFVSDWAYAAYALGAEWEARERYRPALAAYLQAVSDDPESVELWTRIGALFCVLDQAENAREGFAQAESLDATYEPLWRMRAMCAERRGDESAAIAAAEQAVALDPLRDETVLLYARLLAEGDQQKAAWPWLRSVVMRSPWSLEAWQAVRAHAVDDAWKRVAAERIEDIERALGPKPRELQARPSSEQIWAAVDAALLRRDVDAARRILRAAHLDVRLLAARALIDGKPDIAASQAKRRLAADPGDSDARAVVALAAEVLGDRAELERVLRLPPDAGAVSAPVAALFGELLLRRAGDAAASAWLGADVPDAERTVIGLRARARRLMEQSP